MIKRFDIWDSDINLEDWDFSEELEKHPDLLEGEDAKYNLAQKYNSLYLEDERDNLDIQLSHPILLIANLGLWNGKRTAYSIIWSGNIKDILYAKLSTSKTHWYCDGYNICCDEIHHNGTNHYIYREIRDEENIQTFLNKIYNGEDIKKSMNYYTRSIATDVARVYGLIV